MSRSEGREHPLGLRAKAQICPTPVRLGCDGGPGRGRTADTAIFSRVLYQLSYRATGEAGGYRTWRARRDALPGFLGSQMGS